MECVYAQKIATSGGKLFWFLPKQSVTVAMEDFFFLISLDEKGRFVTLVQARFGGKGLDLASKRGKKEESGLASPVVLPDLLDILPHPDAARVETPVMLQTWLEALAQEKAIQVSFWAPPAFPTSVGEEEELPQTQQWLSEALDLQALTTHLPKRRPGMTLSHNHVCTIKGSILPWKSFQKGSAIPAPSSRVNCCLWTCTSNLLALPNLLHAQERGRRAAPGLPQLCAASLTSVCWGNMLCPAALPCWAKPGEPAQNTPHSGNSAPGGSAWS